MDEQTAPPGTEQITAAAQATWSAIRARHPELGPVMVTLGSSRAGKPGTIRRGTFTPQRWRTDTGEEDLGEVFLPAEGLDAGPGGMLTELLHQAAHALAAARGIPETSNKGRYHNRRFAALAGEVGLAAEVDPHDEWRGFATLTLAEGTEVDYAPELDTLAGVATVHRRPEPPREGRRREPAGVAAVCACGYRIRAARSTLAAATPLCARCGQAFRVDEPAGHRGR
jgi:hypothetical protein